MACSSYCSSSLPFHSFKLNEDHMSQHNHTRQRCCSTVAYRAIAGLFSSSFAGSETEHSTDVVIIGRGCGSRSDSRRGGTGDETDR
jgi:hypothetical protein